MQRPTSVTVFGVLNVIFGALGLIGVAITAVALFVVRERGGQDPLLGMNAAWDSWTKASLLLGGVAVVLLLVSGIGLLSMRPWGRSWAVGYAIYGVIVGVLGVVVPAMILARPALQGLEARGNPEAVGAMIGLLGGTVIGGCMRLVYPALLWYYMTRPHVVAAFSGYASDALQPMWPASGADAWTPQDSSNPYLPPQPVALPKATPGGISESIVETLVPSKNGPALVSYYFGIFSLMPCLGFPMGVVAVYYGIQGLRRVRENPAVRGGAHAWVGVICGGLFGLFNLLLLIAAIAGIIAGANHR
jgi:hypothetical protein